MYFIGIAGGSGSGKTTFSKKILAHLASDQVINLHQDSYYLPAQPKDNFLMGKPNFDHPSAFDWPLLKEQIHTLSQGGAVDCPVYDFTTSTRKKETVRIGPAKVIIFDGIYTLWDQEIRNHLDLKVFLHVDADIRFIRRLHRDVRERGRSLDSIIKQYYDTVRPMHRQFLEATQQFADITVGEETDIAADVIASKIKAVLA